MPQLRSVPEPEAARAAPPAPALGAVSRPAVAEPLPASAANMVPEPAPPVPVLDPVAPPPSTVKPESQRNPESQTKPGAQRKPEPKRASAATTVATLDMPATATATGASPALQDRAQIERVAGLYRDNPGTVRVVGYAAAPAAGGTAGGDPLASYHAALERAQAVAKALTEAGIPANKIQTEASPAAGARTPGRVEIQFAQ
jgi:outer membrane protein OmpA-like peptidoglycan-associated protein